MTWGAPWSLLIGLLAMTPCAVRGEDPPQTLIPPPPLDLSNPVFPPSRPLAKPLPARRPPSQIGNYPVLPDEPAKSPQAAAEVTKKRFNGVEPGPEEDPLQGAECCEHRRFTVLPPTLLWQPPLANPRQPRSYLKQTSLNNQFTDTAIDTGIGLTFPLLRLTPPSWYDGALQLDMFAVHFARSFDFTTMALQDYRFGFIVTGAAGPWQAKAGYEHTSCHTGDELIRRFGLAVNPESEIRDDLVFGLSCSLLEQFRLYGMFAYAINVGPSSSDRFERVRYETGLEWLSTRTYLRILQPFAAADVEWRADQNYTTNVDVQAGVRIQGAASRVAARIFLEYYRGGSPYGQMMSTQEEWGAIAFAIDY